MPAGTKPAPLRVVNETRGTLLADALETAHGFFGRGRGLMFRRGLPPGGGLLIRPCNSVVSFFMRFPIDVVFVGDNGRVLHIIHAMPAWRTSRVVRGGRMVVELPAGVAASTGTEVGDTLQMGESER